MKNPETNQKKICIYCGSKNGADPRFMKNAFSIGQKLAQNHLHLVYGGANVGLMGAVADGALSANGRVTGFIPQLIFEFEVAHSKITELITVESMHERKIKMMEMSDAFIALPGGFGTMDELNEIITWRQIKIHNKPIAIFNDHGFYDDYVKYLNTAVKNGFISQAHLDMIIIESDFDILLNKIKNEF